MNNIMVDGKITNKMGLVFTFGQKIKDRVNYLEIDMKDNGKMVKETDMVFSIMQMDLNIRVSGEII